MASVAKWLRQWFVVPPFVGSIPIVRPYLRIRPTARRMYASIRHLAETNYALPETLVET
jgi:hypothetical protein